MARTTKNRPPAGDLGMGLVFAGAILMIAVLAFGTSRLVPIAALLILAGLVVALRKRGSAKQPVDEAPDAPEVEEDD